ncbi:XRE family transcriptional regulator [Ktedonosporobacter rubrisoli]|uniref:XRE family transcriptional regulator n=1 Tax=Ktedonosporobacter rubrisoli TaxID=2509675 RepID=A0A4P6K2R3_KTERU|nr:helix-turn-helix transcriptional regulator [Ktedonosporobacter rubrisoli]QBD82517.1 XRE family transcriptional regulator [Ktedonosporobacter rubrisoli]
MSTNNTLRTLRESLNLSIQGVAEGAKVSFRTVLRAEKGYPLNPGSRQRLCSFYGKTAEELGLVAQRRRSRNEAACVQKREGGELEISRTTLQDMQTAVQEVAQDDVNADQAYLLFLQALGTAGVTLSAVSEEFLPSSIASRGSKGQTADVSPSTIENLAQITQQYRSLHRAGFPIEESLRSHMGLLHSALENTVNDQYRCKLWGLLAQFQLLARQSATRRRELGQARTWNESAIAAAQYSGDACLLGAALGHLGHLYLTWQRNPTVAHQLIDQACEYAKGHPIRGWFAIVNAAIAATEENKALCEASITQALEIVHTLPRTAEADDMYYTDFNPVGVSAFAGNCLLKVGEPEKALGLLSALDVSALASNRQASTFCDMAHAYATVGDLASAQSYAFRSLDKALETKRLYIIPRLISLANKMLEHNPHEAHASAIMAYAHNALYERSTGA